MQVDESATELPVGTFAVDKLVGKRSGGYYLVKWTGFPESQNSWQHKCDITPSLVRAFEQEQKVQRTLKKRNSKKRAKTARKRPKIQPSAKDDCPPVLQPQVRLDNTDKGAAEKLKTISTPVPENTKIITTVKFKTVVRFRRSDIFPSPSVQRTEPKPRCTTPNLSTKTIDKTIDCTRTTGDATTKIGTEYPALSGLAQLDYKLNPKGIIVKQELGLEKQSIEMSFQDLKPRAKIQTTPKIPTVCLFKLKTKSSMGKKREPRHINFMDVAVFQGHSAFSKMAMESQIMEDSNSNYEQSPNVEKHDDTCDKSEAPAMPDFIENLAIDQARAATDRHQREATGGVDSFGSDRIW